MRMKAMLMIAALFKVAHASFYQENFVNMPTNKALFTLATNITMGCK